MARENQTEPSMLLRFCICEGARICICEGTRIKAVAVSLGKMIIGPEVLDDTDRGQIVQYHAAITTRRRIFVSKSFRETTSSLFSILEVCAGMPTSKWKLLPGSDMETFRSARAQAKEKSVFMGIFTKKEVPRTPGKCVFSFVDFLAFVEKVNARGSRIGVCGQ